MSGYGFRYTQLFILFLIFYSEISLADDGSDSIPVRVVEVHHSRPNFQLNGRDIKAKLVRHWNLLPERTRKYKASLPDSIIKKIKKEKLAVGEEFLGQLSWLFASQKDFSRLNLMAKEAEYTVERDRPLQWDSSEGVWNLKEAKGRALLPRESFIDVILAPKGVVIDPATGQLNTNPILVIHAGHHRSLASLSAGATHVPMRLKANLAFDSDGKEISPAEFFRLAKQQKLIYDRVIPIPEMLPSVDLDFTIAIRQKMRVKREDNGEIKEIKLKTAQPAVYVRVADGGKSQGFPEQELEEILRQARKDAGIRFHVGSDFSTSERHREFAREVIRQEQRMGRLLDLVVIEEPTRQVQSAYEIFEIFHSQSCKRAFAL